MSQQFTTTDVLRLEIEDDPTGLVNLVQNPSGDLGGWGWVTPIANTAIYRHRTIGALSFETYPQATPPHFHTEAMPVSAGQYVAASVKFEYLPGQIKVRFEFLDSNQTVIAQTAQSGIIAMDYYGGTITSAMIPATVAYGPYLAPANTAYVRLRMDAYSETGGAPTTYMDFWFKEVTVAKAATSAELSSTRTNLVPNPSFEVNTTGWSSNTGSIARSTAQAFSGAACLALTESVVYNYFQSAVTALLPVSANATYTASAYTRAAATARTAEVHIEFRDAAGTWLSSSFQSVTNTTTGWTRMSVTATAPSNATQARVIVGVDGTAVGETHYFDAVLMEKANAVGSYFDGSIPDAGGVDYAWTGTAHASSSTATSANLSYIEPVPYLNVLGPTHEIKLSRQALNVGSLTATILDSSLDPSQDNLIRPGRRCRLTALSNGIWEPIYTGKVSEASVSYHLKDPNVPDQKQARIQLTSVDGIATLANQKRTEGVETIAKLPYVLEGCGVPWNVNGSGNQVPSAPVVAINDNASALDQIAITRDTALGYAWVDRHGVVQVWDAASLSDTAGPLADDDISDADLSFNTGDLINEVWIKFLRYNPSTGQTEEVPYGPYRSETSIAEWGVRSAEFTIQGAAEQTSNLAAYAQSILTANATPKVTLNSALVPITDTADITEWAVGTDLYKAIDPAMLAYNPAGVILRVTSIEHTITPKKWLARLGFSIDNAVASPTLTPSPGNPEGKTIGELLRPVGEVTEFLCAKADIPAGWLPLDGGTYSATEYPKLYALLQTTTLPDATDRFSIGAGTKALLTTGGAPTKPVPPHTHTHTTPEHQHTISAQGAGTIWSVASGSLGDAPRAAAFSGHNHGGQTGNVVSNPQVTSSGPTGSAFDVMNPWIALWKCVRAV